MESILREVRNSLFYSEEEMSKTLGFNDEISTKIREVLERIMKCDAVMNYAFEIKTYDNYTFYHSANVACLSLAVGIELGLDKNTLYELAIASLLHDFGKILVDKRILTKSGRLNDEEYTEIKKHSLAGYKQLKAEVTDLPELVYAGVLEHHERINGTGYPYGKKGNKISLPGKIIAITDVFDSLISERPYKEAWSIEDASEHINTGSSTMFDSKLVTIFLTKVLSNVRTAAEVDFTGGVSVTLKP